MTKTQLNALGVMSQLSQLEVDRLSQSKSKELYQVFRKCCLAVLNSGAEKDDLEALMASYEDFDVNLVRRERGVKIELINPPQTPFVDGKLMRGVHEHLFSVLRDLLHMGAKYETHELDLSETAHITHMVFDMLRNAEVINSDQDPNLVVCWGGHSINEIEYQIGRASCRERV